MRILRGSDIFEFSLRAIWQIQIDFPIPSIRQHLRE
jgi:hypothetical protein